VLLFASMGAAAADRNTDDLPRVIVKFGDLDLNRTAGAERLYARIRSAARGICASVPDAASPRMSTADEHRCMEKAISDAVADVNAPLLTRLHVAKSAAPITLARK
jgi:UrcA family protein